MSFFIWPLNWLVLLATSNYPLACIPLWSLFWLSIFGLRLLITLLVSFWNNLHPVLSNSNVFKARQPKGGWGKVNNQYQLLNVTYSWGRTRYALSQWTSDTHAVIHRITIVNRYLHLLCGYAVYYVHIHVANIRHIRSYLKKKWTRRWSILSNTE